MNSLRTTYAVYEKSPRKPVQLYSLQSVQFTDYLAQLWPFSRHGKRRQWGVCMRIALCTLFALACLKTNGKTNKKSFMWNTRAVSKKLFNMKALLVHIIKVTME